MNNQWKDGPNLPVGGGGLFSAYLGGYIHSIGGESFSPNRVYDQHFVYSITKKNWTTAVKPSAPKHGSAAVVLGQKIVLIGGATKPDLSTIYSTSSKVDALGLSAKK